MEWIYESMTRAYPIFDHKTDFKFVLHITGGFCSA